MILANNKFDMILLALTHSTKVYFVNDTGSVTL